jgi:hypothetical protein
MRAGATDYLGMSIEGTRASFVAECPYFFLVGQQVLYRPERPRRTEVFEVVDASFDDTNYQPNARRFDELHAPETLVLAVRKVQSAFESMITVGRTNNNDIVIPDVNVSRFHAFFRVHDDRVDLSDAGSANGTWVAGKPLAPKGSAQIVIPGDRLSFAHLEFVFLDAGATYDRLHTALR